MALVVFGLALSLGYYPALAADLAPKQVFSNYERLAGPREPLGLLGMAGSSAAYYTHRPIHWLETAQAAARWLNDDRQRRFLVVRARDLPEINSRYRKHTTPPTNVPVLDASSSEILLVSNQARNGKSNNPFDDWIVSRRPRVQRSVSANLGDQLEVVGWELRDAKGALTDTLLPGRAYQLALIYEVVNQLEMEYQTFVHIDGHGRRYNGDHPTLQGKYPLALLNRGDVFVDEHTVVLEPNFTPGDYSLYFGMFNGSRRLSVTRGRHVDDRVMGGLLKVR
jgi:hypothetical protein